MEMIETYIATPSHTIVSQPSKCLNFMTFGRDVLSYAIKYKYLSEALATFYHG